MGVGAYIARQLIIVATMIPIETIMHSYDEKRAVCLLIYKQMFPAHFGDMVHVQLSRFDH